MYLNRDRDRDREQQTSTNNNNPSVTPQNKIVFSNQNQSQSQNQAQLNQGCSSFNNNSSNNINCSCNCSSSHEKLEDRVRILEKEVQFLRGKTKKDEEWKKLIQDWIYQQYDEKLRDFKCKLSQLTDCTADNETSRDRNEDEKTNRSQSQLQLFNPHSYSSRCGSSSTNSASNLQTVSGTGTGSLTDHDRFYSTASCSTESNLSGFFLPIPMHPSPAFSSRASSVKMGTATETEKNEKTDNLNPEAPVPVIVPTEAQRRLRKRSSSFQSVGTGTGIGTGYPSSIPVITVNNSGGLQPSGKISSTPMSYVPPPADSVLHTQLLIANPKAGGSSNTGSGSGSASTLVFPASNIFTNNSPTASGTSKIPIEADVINISDDSDDSCSGSPGNTKEMVVDFPDQSQETSCSATNHGFASTYFNVGYGTVVKREPEFSSNSSDSRATTTKEASISSNTNDPSFPPSVIFSTSFNSAAFASSSASTSTSTSTAIIPTSTRQERPSSIFHPKDTKDQNTSKDSSSGKSKPRVCRDWRKICTYPSFQDARNDIMSSKAYTYRCKTESGCGTKTVYACKFYQKTRCPVALYVLQPLSDQEGGATPAGAGETGGEGGPLGQHGASQSDEVSVYETIGIVHNHTNYNARKTGSSGGQRSTDKLDSLSVTASGSSSSSSSKKRQIRLSQEVQNIVRHLFKEGIRKPTGIMAAINKTCPEIKIEMAHLKLFVIRLKQEVQQ